MKILNLKDNSDKIKEEFQDDKVEVNKRMSRILREAQHRAKPRFSSFTTI